MPQSKGSLTGFSRQIPPRPTPLRQAAGGWPGGPLLYSFRTAVKLRKKIRRLGCSVPSSTIAARKIGRSRSLNRSLMDNRKSPKAEEVRSRRPLSELEWPTENRRGRRPLIRARSTSSAKNEPLGGLIGRYWLWEKMHGQSWMPCLSSQTRNAAISRRRVRIILPCDRA